MHVVMKSLISGRKENQSQNNSSTDNLEHQDARIGLV